jgi:hypothetical protein
MANQAFALSPISARASLPSDEDYDAIREAFMETARGRWFLDEYARRNRNADTRMVLDAVSRIEETLAAQHQPPPPPPGDKRAEALAAIASAVGAAEQAASTALDGLGLEESLAPIRKGARIVKEISWRWREIGADGRICDLLDSQVGAIEAGCSRISEVDPRIALREAFDIIKASISAFSDLDEGAHAPAIEEFASAANPLDPVAEEQVGATSEPPGEEEYDESMLERVAIEMAAPDLDDLDAEFAVTEPEIDERPQARMTEPPRVEPVLAEPTPGPAAVLEPVLPLPSVAPEPAPSLGASILANGLVVRPKAPANDPLAPIRRMSQIEKIAFFS